jgi:hypothetical protein
MGAGNIFLLPVEVGSEKVCEPKTYYVEEEFLNTLGFFTDEEMDFLDWDFKDVCERMETMFKNKFRNWESGDGQEVSGVFSEIRNSNGTLLLEEKNSLCRIVAIVSQYDDFRIAFGIIPCDYDKFVDYAVYTGSTESEAFARKYGIPVDVDPYEQEHILEKAYKKFVKQYYTKQAAAFENYLKTSPDFKGMVYYRTSAWTSGLL